MNKILILYFFLISTVYGITNKELKIIYNNSGYDTFYNNYYSKIEQYNNYDQKNVINFLLNKSYENKNINNSSKLLKQYIKKFGLDYSIIFMKIKLNILEKKYDLVKYNVVLIMQYTKNVMQIYSLTNFLSNAGLYDEVIKLYKFGRAKIDKRPYSFFGNLLRIYEIQQKYIEYIDESLNFFIVQKQNHRYYLNKLRSIVFGKKLFKEFDSKVDFYEKEYSKLSGDILLLLADVNIKLKNMNKVNRLYRIYVSKLSDKNKNVSIFNILKKLLKLKEYKLCENLLNFVVKTHNEFIKSDYYYDIYYDLNIIKDYKFGYYIFENIALYSEQEKKIYLNKLINTFYIKNDYNSFIFIYKKYNKYISTFNNNKKYYKINYLNDNYKNIFENKNFIIKSKDSELLYCYIMSLYLTEKYKLCLLYVNDFINKFSNSKEIDLLLFLKKIIKDKTISDADINTTLLIIKKQSKLILKDTDIKYWEITDSLLKIKNESLFSHLFKLFCDYLLNNNKINYFSVILKNETIIKPKLLKIYLPFYKYYKMQYYLSNKKNELVKKIRDDIIINHPYFLYFNETKKIIIFNNDK